MSQTQPSEELYPYNNPVTSSNQPTTPSPTHSNGSFGPVFAVLAVIVVISAVACVLGRFCNKRRKNRSNESGHHNKKSSSSSHKQQSHHHGLGPQEWESKQKPAFNMNSGYGDIELGFGKGKFSGHQKEGKHGGKDKSSNKNGGHKHEVRFDDDFSGH